MQRASVDVIVEPAILTLPWWNPLSRLPADASVGFFVLGLAIVVGVAALRVMGRLRGRAGVLAALGAGLAVLAALEMGDAYEDGPSIARALQAEGSMSDVGEIDVHALARGDRTSTTAMIDGEEVDLVLTARPDEGAVEAALDSP
ncbi:hypothetical protein ACHAAC_01800 [Aeromicrobium sp. CF4.19]|uniref:hypothetical protein n=1 Tax=Aeromicrobium sp. CF4.19 TaxID=3373082 RepID=UPI003EE6FCAB